MDAFRAQPEFLQSVDVTLASLEKVSTALLTLSTHSPHPFLQHCRLNHIDAKAALACAWLDPAHRAEVNEEDAVQFILTKGTEYLLFKRFGDTSAWPAQRVTEAKLHLKLKLQAQTNLYSLLENPFADALGLIGSPKEWWQAKLKLAPELSHFAVFMFSVRFFFSEKVSQSTIPRFVCLKLPLNVPFLIKNSATIHCGGSAG